MCGVIGLTFERDREDLGQVATKLLRALEYRGYDSTGAAVLSGDGELELRKGVGAPSKVCEELGISDLSGRLLCGQVRWATFGVVDEVNAQPHAADCLVPVVGAHNGNVTNSDKLQTWLLAEGHRVRSDNDGEMVVHTIEHCFARRLADRTAEEASEPELRSSCMLEAIVEAGRLLKGSYAAVIADRVTGRAWAVRAGSSLYAGVGEEASGGRFVIASSDLSAVLRLTRRLITLKQNEVIALLPEGPIVYSLVDGTPLDRDETRSRLLARDIALQPPYQTFMEQEIAAQPETVRDVVRLFEGGSPRLQKLKPAIAALPGQVAAELSSMEHALRAESRLKAAFERLEELLGSESFGALSERAGDVPSGPFTSSEGALLEDLCRQTERGPLELVDAWIEHHEVKDFRAAASAFADRCIEAHQRGRTLYAVCCGSSFHAARAGALFFAEMAGVHLSPSVPGDFRGHVLPCLRDGDVVMVVSQSGETKDVVDVLLDVQRSGLDIVTLGLVNNLNSTLGQELCDVVVPLRCGPEVAVAATKSFINQLAVFHGLALEVGRRRVESGEAPGLAESVERREQLFGQLPDLLSQTLKTTAAGVEEVAERLHLRPTMHILASRLTSVALEGALKVREVVLNHTQGYEASEFKHGPNTILGRNTIYRPRQIRKLMRSLEGTDPTRIFSDPTGSLLDALDTEHPLIYVTGPDPRDLELTVSQVNTHKIRGSTTVAVAEDDPDLRQAVFKPPAGRGGYEASYLTLPETGDHVATAYTATLVLQRLALRMSERKAAFLDALGVLDHGVHPDVPKNVSKSITVD
jgi:glutamine---fructose-6-phosphate transaminase (isomerizing)